MSGKNDIDPLSVTDGKISNSANISFKKLAKATEGQVLVAQADGRFAAKSLSGDVSLQSSGAVTVTSVVTAESGGTTTVVTGPQGVAGVQGAVGPQGEQGPAGSDATVTTSAVDAAGAVMETDLIQTSAGAGDANKPVKLDATGKIDASMIDGNDVSYDDIADKPSSFTPSTHASTHATGGTDAIAPSDIGAAAHDHDHDDDYLGIAAKAADSDKLDGNDSSAFALAGHNHDTVYLGIAAQAADSDMLDGQHGADFAAADHGHTASDVTDGTFANARISAGSVTQHQASIDHDELTNFVANEHIDWAADQGATNIHTGNYNNTEYTAGTGLSLSGTEFSYDNSVIASQVDLSNTSALHLSISNNLSDLNNAGTARTNLGLGSAAQSATTDFASSGHTHSAATTSAGGFMSSGDKTKLDSYPSTDSTHNNEFLRKDGTFTSTPSGIGTYSAAIQMDASLGSGGHHFTIEHGLGTQGVIVQVRTYAGTNGNTRAQRFSAGEGVHLDIGYHVDVISCDADGDISNNHISLDFEQWMEGDDGVDNEWLYVTVIG